MAEHDVIKASAEEEHPSEGVYASKEEEDIDGEIEEEEWEAEEAKHASSIMKESPESKSVSNKHRSSSDRRRHRHHHSGSVRNDRRRRSGGHDDGVDGAEEESQIGGRSRKRSDSLGDSQSDHEKALHRKYHGRRSSRSSQSQFQQPRYGTDNSKHDLIDLQEDPLMPQEEVYHASSRGKRESQRSKQPDDESQETEDGEILEDGELDDEEAEEEQRGGQEMRGHSMDQDEVQATLSKSSSKEDRGEKLDRKRPDHKEKKRDSDKGKRKKYVDMDNFDESSPTPAWGSGFQGNRPKRSPYNKRGQSGGKQSSRYSNMRHPSPPGLYDSPSEPEDSEEDIQKSIMSEGYMDASVAADEKEGIFKRGISLKKKKRERHFDNRKRGRNMDCGKMDGPPKKKPLTELAMSERPVCKFYLDGKCAKGSNCQFNHDVEKPKRMEVCKYHLTVKGCHKEKCPFMHENFPCKYYHTGAKCFSGDRCKFSHDPLTEETRRALEMRVAAGDIIQVEDPDYDYDYRHRDYESRGRPSLLGSPPRHRGDMKKIPSLFEIEVHPPSKSPKPSPQARPSGFYSETNASPNAGSGGSSAPSGSQGPSMPDNSSAASGATMNSPSAGIMSSAGPHNQNISSMGNGNPNCGNSGLLQHPMGRGMGGGPNPMMGGPGNNVRPTMGGQHGMNPQQQQQQRADGGGPPAQFMSPGNGQQQSGSLPPVLNMLGAIIREAANTMQKGNGGPNNNNNSNNNLNMGPNDMRPPGMANNMGRNLPPNSINNMGGNNMNMNPGMVGPGNMSMGPNSMNQGMNPNLNHGMRPNIVNQNMGPNSMNQSMGPNIRNPNMGPNAMNQNMGPIMMNPHMGPSSVNQNMGPNSLNLNMGPNMYQNMGTTNGNPSAGSVSMNGNQEGRMTAHVKANQGHGGQEVGLMDVDYRIKPEFDSTSASDQGLKSELGGMGDTDDRIKRDFEDTEENSQELKELDKIRRQIQEQIDNASDDDMEGEEEEEQEEEEKEEMDEDMRKPIKEESLSPQTLDVKDGSNADDKAAIKAEVEAELANLEIPAHLPKKQRELFLRIQQQHLMREKDRERQEALKAEEIEAKAEVDDWYSSDEEGSEENKPKLTDVLKKLNEETSSATVTETSQTPVAPTSLAENSTSSTSTASTFNIMQMINAIKNHSVPSSSTSSSGKASIDGSASVPTHRRASMDPLQAKNSSIVPTSPPPTSPSNKQSGHHPSMPTLHLPTLTVDPPVVSARPLNPLTYAIVKIALNMPKTYTQLPKGVDASDPTFKNDPRVKWHIQYLEKQLRSVPKESERRSSEEGERLTKTDPRLKKAPADPRLAKAGDSPRGDGSKPADPRLRKAQSQTRPTDPRIARQAGKMDPRLSRQTSQEPGSYMGGPVGGGMMNPMVAGSIAGGMNTMNGPLNTMGSMNMTGSGPMMNMGGPINHMGGPMGHVGGGMNNSMGMRPPVNNQMGGPMNQMGGMNNIGGGPNRPVHGGMMNSQMNNQMGGPMNNQMGGPMNSNLMGGPISNTQMVGGPLNTPMGNMSRMSGPMNMVGGPRNPLAGGPMYSMSGTPPPKTRMGGRPMGLRNPLGGLGPIGPHSMMGMGDSSSDSRMQGDFGMPSDPRRPPNDPRSADHSFRNKSSDSWEQQNVNSNDPRAARKDGWSGLAGRVEDTGRNNSSAGSETQVRGYEGNSQRQDDFEQRLGGKDFPISSERAVVQQQTQNSDSPGVDSRESVPSSSSTPPPGSPQDFDSDSQKQTQRFNHRNDPRFKRVKRFTGQRKTSMDYSSPLGGEEGQPSSEEAGDGSPYNSYNKPKTTVKDTRSKIVSSPSLPDILHDFDLPELNSLNVPQPEPELKVKDLFKTIDPTASPFC